MERDRQPLALIAYVVLHFQSGCRISDLLNVDYTAISNNLNISILQGKGSLPLTVQPIYHREFWQQVKRLKLKPMEPYNRFFFYRLYKRYGIVIEKGANKNAYVTHAFRKNLADDLNRIDNNELRAQGALGHRSKSSTKRYLLNNNKSSSNKK